MYKYNSATKFRKPAGNPPYFNGEMKGKTAFKPTIIYVDALRHLQLEGNKVSGTSIQRATSSGIGQASNV